MSRTTTIRTATSVAVLVVAALSGTSPSWAGAAAIGASATQGVGSGVWSIVPTTASSAPYGTGALTLNFPKVPNAIAPPQYFNVVNTGSFSASGATYTVSGLDTTQVTVEACSSPGTWNETTGACSTTIITLVTTASGTTSGTAVSTTVPTAVGALQRTRVKPLAVSKNATDAYTVGVLVARSQIRAGTTTNS